MQACVCLQPTLMLFLFSASSPGNGKQIPASDDWHDLQLFNKHIQAPIVKPHQTVGSSGKVGWNAVKDRHCVNLPGEL